MAQRAIPFSEAVDNRIHEAVEKRGFSSPTAFIRYAVEQELKGRQDELISVEERVAASIGQVWQAVVPIARGQQALFALVDSLAKMLLTCIPEPDGHAFEAALARAKARHVRLLKSASQAMGGDSWMALEELVKYAKR